MVAIFGIYFHNRIYPAGFLWPVQPAAFHRLLWGVPFPLPALFKGPPVRDDTEDDHCRRKYQERNEINADHIESLSPEDDASQRMYPIILRIDNSDPAQPVRHPENRVESPRGHEQDEVDEGNR